MQNKNSSTIAAKIRSCFVDRNGIMGSLNNKILDGVKRVKSFNTAVTNNKNAELFKNAW